MSKLHPWKSFSIRQCQLGLYDDLHEVVHNFFLVYSLNTTQPSSRGHKMAPNIKISYLLSRSFRFFIRYPDSDMLVLSTRSIMWIGHRKEIRKLIFEHKPFVGANRGIVGCACSICKKMELRYWLVPGNVKYNRIWSDAQRKMIGREIWTKKHWTELIVHVQRKTFFKWFIATVSQLFGPKVS